MPNSPATDPSSCRSSRKLTRGEASWVEGQQSRSRGFERLFGIGAGLLCLLLGGLGLAGGVYELFRTEWKGLLLVGAGILLLFLGFLLLVMGLISSRDKNRPLPRVRRIRGALSLELHGSGRARRLRWTLQGIPFTRLLDPRWEEEFVEGEAVTCELVLQDWIHEGSSRQGWLLGIRRNGAQPEEPPSLPEEEPVPESSDPAVGTRGNKPFPMVVQFLIAAFMMSVLALVSSMWREMFPRSRVHWHFGALLLGFSALCLVPPLRPAVSPEMAWHLWQARTLEAHSQGKAGTSSVRPGDRVVIARALAVETGCAVPTRRFALPDRGTCFVPAPRFDAASALRSWILSALLGLLAVTFPFHALLAFWRQRKDARLSGQATE